jgi:hypothetical protein
MTPEEHLRILEDEWERNSYGNHRTPSFMNEIEAFQWYDARDTLQAKINNLRNRIYYGEVK